MYGEDLAFIHDAGFADFALGAAPGVLAELRRHGLRDALVVDLGCGSGLWAGELVSNGYRVIGVDISDSMISIARRRVPAAEFRVESLFDFELPKCGAITALGECFNYLFDREATRQGLVRLFRRAYDALADDGLLIFDLAGPGQVPAGEKVRMFTEGDGWVVLAEKEEDAKRCILTRRIVTFRKGKASYRRSDEIHRQRLFEPGEIAGHLRSIGFRVRVARGFGQYKLLPGRAAFIARKPG
jgi:SAM-dependent methyltransferase